MSNDIRSELRSFPSAGDVTTVTPVSAQRVLRNTTEQAVLAALAWPALAIQLAPTQAGLFPALAVSFLIGRVAFALGYAKGAAGRAFGFGLTFYPTVVVVIWASLRALLG